ncbi:UNVERIFIED_CONTAM: hypothetical protein Sradi_1320500 [Sesamum radiatum]|uniref:Fe2OG dioxygenase domain-containing protein n=1 Tax=Sesamum radiatum TaxID=300843 RepID=A0AAW2URZ5_SESRA
MNRGRGGYRGGGGGGRHYGARGRSPRPVARFVVRNSPVGDHSDDASSAHGSGSSTSGRRNSEIESLDGITKKFDGTLKSDYPYGPSAELLGAGIASDVGSPKLVQNVAIAEDQMPKPLDLPFVTRPGYDNDFPSLSAHSELSARTIKMTQAQDVKEDNRTTYTPLVDMVHKKEKPSQTTGPGFQVGQFSPEVQSGKSTTEGIIGKGEYENSDFQPKGFSFDICEERSRSVVKLKAPLHVKNRAMRNEMKRHIVGDNIKIFRPGMILIKGYLSLMDQVKLIMSCRDLGRGPGGFYQPGYGDGAKLHLKMMCLGKNWDPETSSYVDTRPVDETKPPPIPDEFARLVKGAIQECHNYLESNSKVRDVRNVLPWMSPDICIINFYTKTGKLGLHQDKDESQESLDSKLPVVSFSLGDSAEFVFGDQRDIDKAEKLILASGDVLIFGGESRHIFHGVSAIYPDTASKALLDETNLRPGRLNLTFRQY